MNVLPKAVARVVESFEKLPGVGPKTAQRLTFYLLRVPQDELERFAESLSGLKKNTVMCSICKNIAEEDPCSVCSGDRDHSTVCVVENPMDVLSIERTRTYHGVYHVLHGAIDPLNNIGPEEIYIADLLRRLKNGTAIKEIILATNSNMEGEATALYITKQIKMQNANVKITRLAHGLPVGGDVEYADEVTLTRALEGRREY